MSGIQVTVTGSTRPTSCPLCRSDLPAERAQVCDGCGTGYHRGCLRDLGGCGTIGCARRGKVPPGTEPRVAARSGAGSGYLAAAAVVLVTFAGLVGLSRVGAHLHPPRTPSGMAFTPRHPPPPAAPARPPAHHEAPPRRPPARVLPAEPPPAPIGTVDRHGSRLTAVTRAAESVRSDLQLLEVCDRAERGLGDAWARGLLEGALARRDPDPVAEVRLRVAEARESGATQEELDAALLASKVSGDGSDDAQVAALVFGTAPSPLARAEVDARIGRALAAIDGVVARQAAAVAYADALEASSARDRVVATLERLLADPEVVFDPAEWRQKLAGSDPHEVARAARRRYVAAGGAERIDPRQMSYDRPVELRLVRLLDSARGVLARDDAAPTPTQRVLAEIEARAEQPRPR